MAKARIIFILLLASYISRVVQCEVIHYTTTSTTTTVAPALTNAMTTTTTTSSTESLGKPTTTSRYHHNGRPYPSSSSSASASAEESLAPLYHNGSNGGGSGSTCVNCPQTVCTLSKVSYTRTAIHHNWRVNGLPDYLTYLEKFRAPFELANDVRFNLTSPMDGHWTFTFSRSGGGSSLPYPIRDDDEGNGDHPLDLRVTYRFMTESRSPPKLAFELWLSAHVEDEYVTLPSQISSHPSLQRLPPPSNKSAWTYLFVWGDIQKKIQGLMESMGLEGQEDVEFKFVINSYQGGNVSSADADCGRWNGEDRNSRNSHGHRHKHHHHPQTNSFESHPGNNNATWPPFLTQMYSLMKDDKYTDLTVKSGDEEYQIHRVIAAYSSPILATMIYNLTYEKSESLLDFGDDIGSDAVEELIRYMYLGKVEDIEEIADRLIVAATTYGFPALKRQCELVLSKLVKTENAFSMYALGVEVGSTRLKRRAFNVMKENKSKIVAQSEEFRKLSVHHPDVMYELFLS